MASRFIFTRRAPTVSVAVRGATSGLRLMKPFRWVRVPLSTTSACPAATMSDDTAATRALKYWRVMGNP